MPKPPETSALMTNRCKLPTGGDVKVMMASKPNCPVTQSSSLLQCAQALPPWPVAAEGERRPSRHHDPGVVLMVLNASLKSTNLQLWR